MLQQFEQVSFVSIVSEGDTLTEGNIEDGTMNTYKLLCTLGLLLLSLTAMTTCHGSERSGDRSSSRSRRESSGCGSCKVPIPVDYKIEHPDTQCTNATPPFPATITVEPNSNALRVMERAVNIGPTYRFKATYFGDTLGYSISEINGVASNNPCFWLFYIEDPDGNEFRSPLGASNFFIPGPGYSIIWRFETF